MEPKALKVQIKNKNSLEGYMVNYPHGMMEYKVEKLNESCNTIN